jgi:hypothetical protein
VDPFSYLSVLLSIILGLAITQILLGVRGIVLSRARVVGYWPTFVFAGLLFLMVVQSWWAMFGLREVPVWTFPMFAIVLLQTTAMYMLTALVLPDFFGEHAIDLRAHYFAHRILFFSLLAATLLISLAKDVVISGHMTDNVNLGFHLGFMAVTLGAVLTTREWYHKLVCVVSALAFVAYIALLFARLH